MGKVFHADDDVHARVKEFCAGHDVSPKMWVGRLVAWAVDQGIVDPTRDHDSGSRLTPAPAPVQIPVQPLIPQYDAVPVEQNKKPHTAMEDRYGIGQAPWEDKPFWDKDRAS